MAKKKTPEETSVPSAPARRRAPAKKQAAPILAPDPAVRASTPTSDNGDRHEPSQAEIAEAAYFRHLNRRGEQGDEFTDWIEAERELRQRQSR